MLNVSKLFDARLEMLTSRGPILLNTWIKIYL
jgi:hypothetical protein